MNYMDGPYLVGFTDTLVERIRIFEMVWKSLRFVAEKTQIPYSKSGEVPDKSASAKPEIAKLAVRA